MSGDAGRISDMVTTDILGDRPPATAQPISDADYPVLFTAADRAAASGHRNHVRLAGLDLSLLLAGAALSTVAPLLPDTSGSVVQAVSAALMVAGIVAKSGSRVRRFDNEWFDGRAVAESIKTSSWRFMMRVPPFDSQDRDAEIAFLTESRAILEARPNLIPELSLNATTPSQITPRMREVRALSLGERKHCYQNQRLDNQIQWYASKAAANRTSAARWFWIGLLAQTAAIALTIVRIEITDGPNFVALIAALAATATAWSQLGRHDELSKSYGLAAQELLLAKGAVDLADTEAEFVDAVVDTESAISREHTLWAAKRG